MGDHGPHCALRSVSVLVFVGCLCGVDWCLFSSQPLCFFGTVISFPLSSDTASHSQRDEKGPYCIHTRLVFISASFFFFFFFSQTDGPLSPGSRPFPITLLLLFVFLGNGVKETFRFEQLVVLSIRSAVIFNI